MNKKGIEAIAEFGSESTENALELMNNNFIRLLLDNLKKESTELKVKIDIVDIFDKILLSNKEVNEEEEIESTVSKLETETRAMIRKGRDLPVKEKKEIRSLLGEISIFNSNLKEKREKSNVKVESESSQLLNEN